jgi:hypothetical protein
VLACGWRCVTCAERAACHIGDDGNQCVVIPTGDS